MFHIGDVVQVMEDLEEVMKLQKGHGEWNEVMQNVSTLQTEYNYLVSFTSLVYINTHTHTHTHTHSLSDKLAKY